MMIDQAPTRAAGMIEAPFLGRNALHDPGPAALAARAGVPFLVAFGRRLPDGSHLVDVPLVLTPEPRAGRSFVERATLAAAAALEQHVREAPEQFLWLHRRWKQPPARGTRAPWTTSSASARTPSARGSSWEPESTRT
jgi:KDO2-lipid IV(A) lauroyltransferase